MRTGGAAQRMRDYWDDRARLNAAWYVDTTLDFDAPDLERFFASGEQIVRDHYELGPAHPQGTEVAVEIGSGLGRICRALAQHFDRVVGVDISAEMVRRARDLVEDPRVTFMVGAGDGLAGLDDSSADLVFSFTVFQHIPRASIVERYLVEAGRVLRPGGVLVFQWNNQPRPVRWQLRRTALALLQRTGIRAEPYGRNAAQFLGSRIPMTRIERALRRGGLQLQAVDGAGTLFAWGWAAKPVPS